MLKLDTDVQVLYDTYKAALSGTVLRYLNGNILACEMVLSAAFLQMKREKTSYKSEQCTVYIWMLFIVMAQIQEFENSQRSKAE